MIRRDICLLLSLVLMGGVIFWITQPREVAIPDEPGGEESVAPVAALKAENSLLLGTSSERSESSERGWDTAATHLLPSLVSSSRLPWKKTLTRPAHAATGLFVSSEGHLLCPDRVVLGAAAIRVRLADGTVEAARVLAWDRTLGQALLQIRRNDTRMSQWALPSTYEKMDRFLVMGRSVAGSEWLSSALLAAPLATEPAGEADHPSDQLLVFDSSMNCGTGAVVVDRRGKVVGLVRDEPLPGAGTKFRVIPSRLIEASTRQMMKKGFPERAQLGAMVQAMDRDTALSLGLGEGKVTGALVSDVLPGLAAEKGGINPGDVITLIGVSGWVGPQDLRAIMAQIPTDQPLVIEFIRNGEARSAEVNLTPAQAPYSSDAGTFDPFPRRLDSEVFERASGRQWGIGNYRLPCRPGGCRGFPPAPVTGCSKWTEQASKCWKTFNDCSIKLGSAIPSACGLIARAFGDISS